MKRILTISVLLSTLISLSNCNTPRKNADTFAKGNVLTGSIMTEEFCFHLPNSVWTIVNGQGDCIRYFSAGLREENNIAIVYFHGDRIYRIWDREGHTIRNEIIAYQDNDPEVIQAWINEISELYQLPCFFISRPGVYGSSGDHKQRRRLREVKLMHKALNEIKIKYKIGHLAIVGQSGGGHLVGSLLAFRDDIVCAVTASGNVAVRKRVQLKGWPADQTGYNDYYDPIDHVSEISKRPDLRIFIIGDPRDKRIPFACQEAYYEALKKAGLNASILKAYSRSKTHHSLGHVGRRVATWCANGIPREEIINRVVEGRWGHP